MALNKDQLCTAAVVFIFGVYAVASAVALIGGAQMLWYIVMHNN